MAERDRLTVDLRGLRDRITMYAEHPRQPIGEQVRDAIAMALEFKQAIKELGLTLPKEGKIKPWLRRLMISRPSRQALFSLFDLEELVKEAPIEADELIKILNGSRSPTSEEAIRLGRVMKMSPAELLEICRNGSADGCRI